jgi:hypothetical protein
MIDFVAVKNYGVCSIKLFCAEFLVSLYLCSVCLAVITSFLCRNNPSLPALLLDKCLIHKAVTKGYSGNK